MGRPHTMEAEYKYPRIVQETRYVMQGGSTKIVLAVSNIKYGKKIVFSCTVVDMSSTLARETLYEEKEVRPHKGARGAAVHPGGKKPRGKKESSVNSFPPVCHHSRNGRSGALDPKIPANLGSAGGQ